MLEFTNFCLNSQSYLSCKRKLKIFHKFNIKFTKFAKFSQINSKIFNTFKKFEQKFKNFLQNLKIQKIPQKFKKFKQNFEKFQTLSNFERLFKKVSFAILLNPIILSVSEVSIRLKYISNFFGFFAFLQKAQNDKFKAFFLFSKSLPKCFKSVFLKCLK